MALQGSKGRKLELVYQLADWAVNINVVSEEAW